MRRGAGWKGRGAETKASLSRVQKIKTVGVRYRTSACQCSVCVPASYTVSIGEETPTAAHDSNRAIRILRGAHSTYVTPVTQNVKRALRPLFTVSGEAVCDRVGRGNQSEYRQAHGSTGAAAVQCRSELAAQASIIGREFGNAVLRKRFA